VCALAFAVTLNIAAGTRAETPGVVVYGDVPPWTAETKVYRDIGPLARAADQPPAPAPPSHWSAAYRLFNHRGSNGSGCRCIFAFMWPFGYGLGMRARPAEDRFARGGTTAPRGASCRELHTVTGGERSFGSFHASTSRHGAAARPRPHRAICETTHVVARMDAFLKRATSRIQLCCHMQLAPAMARSRIIDCARRTHWHPTWTECHFCNARLGLVGS
jgi:hypothetical protein